ncbi:MAG TPA: DNA polymerase III subunit alpha [Armatimonadota bacterium]|jgi:DNA polymerase-3 subunit alpha
MEQEFQPKKRLVWSDDGGWRTNDGRPASAPVPPPPPPPAAPASYVELHCHSQHSLRDGAAHIEDLAARAKALGMPALGVTDHDSMAVAPEFRAAAVAEGVKPIQGVEVSFAGHAGGAFHLTLLAETDEGFGHLCEILTLMRGPMSTVLRPQETAPDAPSRRNPFATMDMLTGRAKGILCLTGCAKGKLAHHLLRREEEEAEQTLGLWADLFGKENVFVELQDHKRGFEPSLNRRLCELADRFDLPVVATNNVHFLARADFWVHEAMACWRAGRLSRTAVFPERPRSAEAYLKGADEIARLFRPRPDALSNTLAIAERCTPVLDPAVRRWPDFTPPPGFTEDSYLDHLVGLGARARYGANVPAEVCRRIQYELRLIRAKGFCGYFLLVWAVCRWMRQVDILYRVRGSAGGSVVAYCLYIATLDPFVYDLSFDRFLNEARSAPPDIDLDIDSRERDRVVDHLRQMYGRDRVASVAAYSTIRGKSLIRDFGPVFDLPPDVIDLASKSLRNVGAHHLGEAFEGLPQLRDAGIPKEPFQPLIDLGLKISRFPSHTQTTVGVVISGLPLTQVSPLWPAAKDGQAAVSYDKDWVERVGLIKTDFLFLRELAAIRDCVRSMEKGSDSGSRIPDSDMDAEPACIQEAFAADRIPDSDMDSREVICGSEPATKGRNPESGMRAPISLPNPESGIRTPISSFDYDGIPLDDPDTFALLASGRTIGVFQLESPAQRVLMQRMRPSHIKDCVAAVALIRPGPITGDAVTPFVVRRTGREPVTYPDERLRPVLEDTYGVVIYQDQVIELAMAAAGWSPDRADQLRRRISHARSKDMMRDIQVEFIAAVLAQGFTQEVADWCFKSILGFASYGFCHAHAAAFGETAYKSAYLLAHYPSHYLMGIMNNYPMAYYPLRTVVAEARRRGVKVLPPDVNRSQADDIANDTTIRAGLKHVHGIKRRTLEAIAAARAEGSFPTVPEFCARVPVSRDEVESLALAGAFDALHPNRKAILRASERLAADGAARRTLGRNLLTETALPRVRDFTDYDKSLKELATLGFCAGPDPVSFHRRRLAMAGVQTCAQAAATRDGGRVVVAGWRTRAHTPPIRSGKTIVFFTLEDETDILDITVFPDVYDIYGRTVFAERMVVVCGYANYRDGAFGVVAESIRPLRDVLIAAREMEMALPAFTDTSMAESGWTLPAAAFANEVDGR